ncbi:MAG: class I SAM-dependent methyltransferase [Actinomycetota bacterium]|nr:class I SAM-dependent methyltransferase [Actinomycetota bacterium]
MPLPELVRRLAPDRLRYSIHLRAFAVATGLVPPRTMHSAAEAALLAELARGRRTAVEIGVYEGSSAVVLCSALPRDADLHLIDPFTGNALLPGWRGVESATRRVVGRQGRARGGPRLHWHVELSEQAAARWSQPLDLLFIDGDHSEHGCRLDWDLWSPFVAPGGIVVFHDAREGLNGGGGLPGPTAVVNALFREPGPPEGWRVHSEVETALAVERLA